MGGSYGGFMSGILTSRYPDVIKCGILKNPVLNIPFMTNITDIPGNKIVIKIIKIFF